MDFADFENSENYELIIPNHKNLRILQCKITPDNTSLWYNDSLIF